MRAALAFALVLSTEAACGPKPPPETWQEHELGGKHATPVGAPAAPVGEPGPLPADLTTLDAAAIDALDEITVAAALVRAGDDAPAGRLALRAARLAHHRGDAAAARAMLARAASAADRADVQPALTALGTELAEPPVDPAIIAVLLPLSGRYAAIGNELRTAIQLVPGVTWLPLDTRGEVDGATAAVHDAIAKGAVAILGPVGERESIAAARAAAVHGLPIALLAPADGADPASGVFRMVDSPADEGRSVAQLAADDNFPTVAVFAPRDDLGRDAAEAFVAEAERLGLAVTGQGTYDPTGGNLEPDVKDFLNLVPAKNPRLAQHLRAHGRKDGWVTFSPDIPFSLLYIPDKYDRAALVAAFLPYFNVELRSAEYTDPALLQRKHGGTIPQLVQLVGGAGWNHPTLPLRGGPAVQGALVVDVFAAELGGDVGAQFAQAFQQRTGRAPSTAAAQAHDAALAVVKAQASLTAQTRDPRAAMRTALASVTLPDGACGPAQMGTDGELHRDPLVLEVVGDVLEVMR